MFWDDIKLVTETVSKYGIIKPFADLGGLEKPCIADYDRTISTGVQEARYIKLNGRPFDHIDDNYIILNPENGAPLIEDLPKKYFFNRFGTLTCLNVLEHVNNPFKVFKAIYKILKKNGLLIISTVFEFPYHPGPVDYWRYSPETLKHLAVSTGFKVLEYGWRLNIEADMGVVNTDNGKPQVVKSVYCVLGKKDIKPLDSKKHIIYKLPLPA